MLTIDTATNTTSEGKHPQKEEVSMIEHTIWEKARVGWQTSARGSQIRIFV
jgi:hypothetical protein